MQHSPTERLATPVQFSRASARAGRSCWQRLGLRTVRDVLFFFPRDYQDLTDFRTLPSSGSGRLVSVRGVVDEVELQGTGRDGRSMLGVLVRDRTSIICGRLWFNQPLPAREVRARAARAALRQGATMKAVRWEMAHPRVQWIEARRRAAGGTAPAGLSADRRTEPGADAEDHASGVEACPTARRSVSRRRI